IGNYGINDAFYQSKAIHARALVVREYCKDPSKMYGGRTLEDFLIANKVPGITGIDTRDLVIKIRTMGTLKGAVTEDKEGIEELIKKLKSMPAPSESNLVEAVTSRSIETHNFGKKLRVGLLDCGEKSGILRDLSARFDVTIFPYDTPADVIMDHKVKGVLLSNGPGDPAHPAILKTTAKTVKDLSVQVPMFGICFGSQIVGIAMGGTTYKMKFGHRGCNQPVKYEGRVYITSQNHGFAVDEHSLDGKDLIVDQVNVNDGSVEGLKHKDLPLFTCQYHPEASPGPWDTSFLFDKFAKTVKEGRM
ncbi:MAG: glutamine-hydrolyzing carbamoyl-phosphate synthase small subunit, partial [Candidatus Methanoplasma sp.]|nr:glutamine-hydrolyzing carbamoyl-phosphate synthase small subunit [Candidatus Methanoplasma sp.]